MAKKMSPEEKSNLINEITEVLDPVLDGHATYCLFAVYRFPRLQKESIHQVIDGKIVYESEESEINRVLNDSPANLKMNELIWTFPKDTKLVFTFKKGETMTAEKCSPEMILKDVSRKLQAKAKKKNAEKLECEIDFLVDGELKLNRETRLFSQGKESKLDDFVAREEIEYLYYALKPKPKSIRFVLENDVLSIQASRAYKKLGITKIQHGLTIESEIIEPIFAYLESGEPEKISAALGALKSNKKFSEQAEARYLNLIRARLNDSGATLKDSGEGMPSKKEAKLLESDKLNKEFISFSYMDEHESKLVVDFVGAVASNFIDAEAFAAEAKKAPTEKELLKLIEEHSGGLLKKMANEAKVYPEGWYSKVCALLSTMKLEKILFEKTEFQEASESLMLDSFMFFLGQASDESIYFDIYQSMLPGLPEMFWMLPKVPKADWGDDFDKTPDSPLKFKRK